MSVRFAYNFCAFGLMSKTQGCQRNKIYSLTYSHPNKCRLCSYVQGPVATYLFLILIFGLREAADMFSDLNLEEAWMFCFSWRPFGARSYTLGNQVYTLFSLISHGHGCAHTASTSLSSGNFSLCLEVTYCEKISQNAINRIVCFKGDNKMRFLLRWSNVYK